MKSNHEDNRKKVCVICFDKNKNVRAINLDLERVIQCKIPGFRLSSKKYPSGRLFVIS